MQALCIIASLAVAASTMPIAAQEREVVDYDIEVVLDPETHELAGSQTVRWRNTTAVATSEIWLHLYLNAFAGSETTFMRELAGDPAGRLPDDDDGWGWTRVTRLALGDGTDLLPFAAFERPDDGNDHDFTVLRVGLPREVPPGAGVILAVDFEARLPRVVARTGHAGDFHMVGQWFPKVAVFEGEAGWNCHQFHASSEFFADFGSYRVRLTVPRGWVVGATGEQVARAPTGTADRVEFRAFDVHDFAWCTAPPDLVTVVETDFDPGRDVPPQWLERAQAALDLGAAELELPPMAIRLLLPRSQQALAPRMVRATRLAIAWFGLFLGPYPQPQLTVVSPPPDAAAAGGMEYPTLITTGARSRDAVPPWRWQSGIERVTVHEFGHQYFQGMLASNEFEAAWLDEGLTTWAENHCVDAIVGDGLAPQLLLDGGWTVDRLALSGDRPPVRIDRRAWDYRRRVDYFLASYTKPAVALRTLEGLLGEAAILRAIRGYALRHRFSHPTAADLRRALESTTGTDLGWFFDAAIHGSAVPDWTVLAVRQRALESDRGTVWRDGAWHDIEGDVGVDGDPAGGGDGDHGPWRVDVEIGRLGDLVGPVEVELVWTDGRSERRWWDGRERWVRWREDSAVRLEQVVVDPDGAWALETDRANNYWRDEPAAGNPLWWLGHALRLAGQLTLPWS